MAIDTNALVWMSQQGGMFSLPAKGTKKPIDKGWQKTPHPLSEALDHVLKGGNVGLLTGDLSGGIIAIDIDVDFEEQISKLDMMSMTTKIFRRNSPDRGKLLFRIDSPPRSRAFVVPGEMKPRVEILSNDRHALIPPSVFEDNDYYYDGVEYGILPITHVELQSIWYTLTNTLLRSDEPSRGVPDDSPTDDGTSSSNSLVERVKEFWKTSFQVFEHFGMTNDARKESNESQWRIPGHGGLIIADPEGPVPWKWYCHSQGIGGDQISAWLFCQSGEKLDPDDPTTFQRILNEMAAIAGIDTSEFTVTIRSVKSQSIPYTDLGNALRIEKLFGNEIRFSQISGKWLVWTGKVWATDLPGGLHDFRVKLIEEMKKEALAIKDKGLRAEAIKWVITSQGSSRLDAAFNLASEIPSLFLPSNRTDQNLTIINCRNGMINLLTGELLPHDKEEYCTKMIDLDYDPDAKCPRWDQFMSEIQPGHPEMSVFLQRWVGYSLTGDTSEQAICFLHGSGANGKSTFLNILFELLGDYAVRCPTEMIMYKYFGQTTTNDIARLKGVRLAMTSELEEGRRLSEGVIKDLTGSDVITARYLYQEFFDFSPTHKLWIYGNSKPVIRGVDAGIWRRIHLVPFEASFMGELRDPQLPQKLRNELPGILAWAVRGCLEWREHRLSLPDVATKAVNEYRSEMDIIRDFIDDCMIVSEEAKPILLKVIYSAYKDWYHREKLPGAPMGKTLFFRHLEERHGFQRIFGSDAMYYYRGWSLQTNGQSTNGVSISFK
jgi:P4 family phage/plasmid primase-like protien